MSRRPIARLALALGVLAGAFAGAGAALAADPAAAPASAPPAMPARVLMMLRAPAAHARVDGSYGASGYGDAAHERSQARVGERIAAAHGFAVSGLWTLPSLGMDCVVLVLPPGADMAASLAALQAHPEVAWAQPVNEFQAQGHADPLYPLQPAASQWHLDELHAASTGRGVRVAVIDSAVDEAHPDLAQAIEIHADFVAEGPPRAAELHGTAVAGLVAARADNGIGIVGIAPQASLLALRACRELDAQHTSCSSLSLAKALSFAIERRADIINLSLSGPNDPLLGRLIDVALARRQQVVAAVDAQAADGGFPASHPGVIAVGDPQGPPGLAAWSAPARDLPTTVPGGGWRMVSGSSFAAGQVSGLLAVMAQAVADSGASPPVPRLVRLPGGAIDACASLLRVSSAGTAAGCRAVLASSGAAAQRRADARAKDAID